MWPCIAGKLRRQSGSQGTTEGLPNREAALEELMLLWLANVNPAFTPFRELFEDAKLQKQPAYTKATATMPEYFATRPPVAPEIGSLLDALRAPMLASPDSLTGQLDFIREHWAEHLGAELRQILLAIDVLREEEIADLDAVSSGVARTTIVTVQPGFGAHGWVGDEYMGYEERVRHRRRWRAAPGATQADHQAPLE